MPQHATKTSFKKGNVANPAGRPPMTPEKYDFKRAMEALLPIALEKLQEMLNAADFEERRFATQTVLDRNLGKAIERKELTGANGAPIQIEDNTPSIRLLLQQALPAGEPVTIEVESDDEN